MVGTRALSRRAAIVGLTAVVSIGLLAPTASAGKPNQSSGGGKPSGSTFTVPDGTYGGTTTATVSNAPVGTWVVSTCYQAGSPVIFNRLQVDGAGQAVLTLGPTDGYTTGSGGADCDAEAKWWNAKRQRWISLATTTFHVSD